MLIKQNLNLLLILILISTILFANDSESYSQSDDSSARESKSNIAPIAINSSKNLLASKAPNASKLALAQETQSNTETTESSDGTQFGMGAGIGSVTINGEIYNHISLRPELTMGKLGIGLDIYFYMDENGKIREEDWDEFSDYLKKIYYIRWGEQGDPFFLKAGALEQVTLGYGILMDGYTNTAQYPQERKVGIHTGMKMDNIGWEAFLADINEITGPGLLGGRVTYQPLDKIGLEIGGTLVMDFDPYQGLNDDDNDGVANSIDMYKNTDDNALIDSIGNALTPSQRELFRDAGINIPDSSILKNGQPTIDDLERKPAGAYALDIGLPVFENKIFKIDIYSQYAQFLPTDRYYYKDSTKKFTPGWGYSFPGVQANILDFITAKVEYRFANKHFLFNFWDRNYDFQRTHIWHNQTTGIKNIYTKQQVELYQNRVLRGVYGLLRADLFNLLTLESRYQHMAASSYQIKSFQTTAYLNPRHIPKLAEARAFYQRNNDENPFDFANPSSNTLLGYRIGLEMGQGAVLYYVFQKSYQDINGNGSIEPSNEAITINTIETGIKF
ncbi:MAG: hypothetical protein K9M80_04315 [Candidatus Marinimicrobia bacterium]|nr:hypothetical protein [Candidatus Neomarinimicrobiota bacterium]